MTQRRVGTLLVLAASLASIYLAALDAQAGVTIKPNAPAYRVQTGPAHVAATEATCVTMARDRTTNRLPAPITTYVLKSGSGAILVRDLRSECEIKVAARERLVQQGQTTTAGSNVLSGVIETKFSTAFQPPTCVQTINFIASFSTAPTQPNVGGLPTVCGDGSSGAGSAPLRWTPPTLNSDGTRLTTLAGYRIVYGVNPDQLVNAIQVSSASATTHTVSNLAPNVYYFAVKAVRADGVESQLSNIVSKTVR